jgi:AcrR family transcriptional regulator
MATEAARGAGRREPLNREKVLCAAMRFADEHGIEALSMRKLGDALGVEAMSLYNHVANKDDIIDGIVDLAMEEFELPPADEDWETAIRRFALSARDALTRHPWACNLMMSRPHLGVPRMRYMDSLCRCLREAGFSPDLTHLAYHTIDSHILGFMLWVQGHSIDKEQAQRITNTVLRDFPWDEYPYMGEHIRQHLDEESHQSVSTFEFTLDLILDGLRRLRDTEG